MDVNYTLARELIELALARTATNPGAREAHQGMADRYRAQLDARRERVVNAFQNRSAEA